MTTEPTTPTRARDHARTAPSVDPLREAVVFVGLVAAMVVGVALAFSNTGDIAPLISMGTPLIAVLLITFLRTPRGSRRALWATFGLQRSGWRSWPVAIVLSFVVIFIIPFGVADLLGSAHFVALSSIDVPQAIMTTIVMLSMVTMMAMGEEIGWRSYLLPRMQMVLPRRQAAIAVGFIHGLFHLPLILLTTTYDSVGSRWIVAPLVVLALTAAGVFYAWLKDRSDSVWPVAVAHATVNGFIDGSGLIVVVAPVALAYTATESGTVTLAAITIAALVLLARGRTWAPRTAPVEPS